MDTSESLPLAASAPLAEPPAAADSGLLRRLYRAMALTRAIDREALALQRQGVLPAYVQVLGQEAAQVGSAAAFDPARDFAFPTYRELGAAMAWGVDPVGYLASHRALWHGGLWDPRAARFAPVNAVVGGPVTHAVGWALGARLDGTDGCALAYFGDGASSQGDVHEAMNTAGVWGLPVVFFCQNNRWALSVPTEEQVAGGSVAARAAGYGIAGERVDGNDAVAVHAAVRRAVERARSGGGPTVVEADTYRRAPHSTSDDPTRYRDRSEEAHWAARDPLELTRRHLLAAGAADAEWIAAADDAARRGAREAADAVSALPEPGGEEMFAHVFARPTATLREQQSQWREWREYQVEYQEVAGRD